MSLSAAPLAAKPGEHSVTDMTTMATDLDARCSLRYAPSVVKKLKYHSSPAKADQCIAVSAISKSN